MSSTTTKQSDISLTQSAAKEYILSSKNSDQPNEELIKREPIDGTPFTVIWTPEKNWFASYKNYQITDQFKTKEEVIEAINYNTWHIIQLLINIMIVETDNIKSKIIQEEQKK